LVAVSKRIDAPCAFGATLSEQAGKERQVLPYRQVRVEVPAQALRHVGNPRAHRAAVPGTGKVAAEQADVAGSRRPALYPLRPGQDGE
jgi:hypothetical protein